MTFFGEIVEPSTRALIDEEVEELPEYTRPSITWEGPSKPPQTINTLLFVETDKLLKLIRLGVLPDKNDICKIKIAGIDIFEFGQNYLVMFGGSKNLVFGEIVEALGSWIEKATNIYCITTSPIALYQNDCLSTKPASLTKCLTTSTEVPFNFCTKLEAPNLVTGLGATVLSYCIHNQLEASLFVVYLDNSPLDSMNSRSAIELLEKLQFPFKSVNLMNSEVISNLYM